LAAKPAPFDGRRRPTGGSKAGQVRAKLRRSPPPPLHTAPPSPMFQSAERYKASLSSGALVASQHASQIGRRARVLGQDAGAKARVASQRALLDAGDAGAKARVASQRVLLNAGNTAQVASQKALQMVSDIKFEKPDTSCFALVGTALNLLNGTTGTPRMKLTHACACACASPSTACVRAHPPQGRGCLRCR
jgi:hypothetical protein